MLKLLNSSILLLLIASCGPRDVAMDGGVSGAGKPTVVSANGERPSSCPAKKVDEVFLRSPVEMDNEVFTGKVTAALGAGGQNCFRIGSTVNLQNGKAGDVRGKVTITKVEIIPLELLSTTHALALGKSESAVRAFALEEIEKAKDVFEAKGMVSITHFKFVEGSATGVVVPKLEDIVVVDKQGERPASCPTKKADDVALRSPVELDGDIFNGTVTAALGAGAQNCFRIGATVNLQNGKAGEVRGKVTVTKIEVLPLEQLSKAHGKALGKSESALKAHALEEIEKTKDIFDAKGMVSITHFKFVEGSATGVTPIGEIPIPVLDENIYKKMIPALKDQLTAKLNVVFANNKVEWEPLTLVISYEKTVYASPIDDIESVVEALKSGKKSAYPAFRVLLTTKKGNLLSFGNLVDGQRLLVMNSDVVEEAVLDIEGSIISEYKVWNALGDEFYPLGLQLYNESTNKITGIQLGSTFRPFVVNID